MTTRFAEFVPSCTRFCTSRVKAYEQGDSAVDNQKPILRQCRKWLYLFCGLKIQKCYNSPPCLMQEPGISEWKRKFSCNKECVVITGAERPCVWIADCKPNYVAARRPTVVPHVT